MDTRTTVLGLDLPYPILLAPTALHKLAHPEGELATVRGAGGPGAAMTLSTLSSVKLEDVAAAASSALWFQLYVQKDKGYTAELVKRAEAAGYRALVITVDTPVDGARNRQQRAKFHLPADVEMANLAPRSPRSTAPCCGTESAHAPAAPGVGPDRALGSRAAGG